MFNRLIRMLAAALLLLAAFGSPAQASQPTGTLIPSGYGLNLDTGKLEPVTLAIPTCTSGFMCLYDTTASSSAVYPISQSWTGCRKVASFIDNKTSYIWNRTGYGWYVWPYAPECDTQVERGYIHPNSQGAMSGVFSNTISYYKRA